MKLTKNKTLRKFAISAMKYGVDLRKIYQYRYLLRYFRDRRTFIGMGGEIDSQYKILFDYEDQAGVASGHYFHQDLIVAQSIFKAEPKRHIDIASRIDGFVAHVASFREIEIFDVRNLSIQQHPAIKFIKGDLMNIDERLVQRADSISCLHALEHFGLGRYGDPISPNGHLIGFKNILNMLEPKGRLYISIPIADRTQTVFNAHRIFSPKDILSWPDVAEKLELIDFSFVDDNGALHKSQNISSTLPKLNFGCGIYTFERKN